MNKKQLIVVCAFIFILTSILYAEQNNTVSLKTIADITAEDEIEQMHKDLLTWTDKKMVEELSRIAINDAYIQRLYYEFKNTIITPPDPDTYKEYSIANGKESLLKVTQLGHKIHNLGLALSEEDFQKYGDLIKAMRDILYIDSKHIPLAIRHDNSRDSYWYELHNAWLKDAENSYNELFSK